MGVTPPCIVSNIGKENNNYHEPIFKSVKEQIQRSTEEFAGEKFEIFDSYHEQLETFEKEYNWCPYIQVKPVIGADLNVYCCQDKAYNLDEGVICSIKNRSFKEAWFSDKSKFFKINPLTHCRHHCVGNGTNKIILEYLSIDENHVMFM